MWIYRLAKREEVVSLWDYQIATHRSSDLWMKWKKEYLYYLDHGMALTFAAFYDGTPVGEGTLLLSPACQAIRGRTVLCDGTEIANINALRIRKKFEGQGQISALMRVIEQEAQQRGFRRLTICAEAKEARNGAIYRHRDMTNWYFVRRRTEKKFCILKKRCFSPWMRTLEIVKGCLPF